MPRAFSAVTAPRAVAPKPSDHGAEPAAVVAGRTRDRQGVQHRAVSGELVVLVEDMELERPLDAPVVHGLERDQREVAIDGHLGELRVLDAVRPPPQDLAVTQVRQILRERFGQQEDVVVLDQLLPGAQTRPPTGPAARRTRRRARRSRTRDGCGHGGRGRSGRSGAGGSGAGVRRFYSNARRRRG